MLVRDTTGVERGVVGIAFRDGANVLQTVDGGFARDSAGVRRPIFSGLTVAISPTSLYASGYSMGTSYPYTANAVATATGGTAPYAYAWVVDSLWSVTNPTSATTSFQSIGLNPGDSSSATGTVTATDANGLTATATVDLNSFNTA